MDSSRTEKRKQISPFFPAPTRFSPPPPPSRKLGEISPEKREGSTEIDEGEKTETS